LRLARCFRVLASIVGGLQDFVAGRLFRGEPSRRLAQGAPALAWRDHFMPARCAMAFRAAGRIDTS
jgi:hypothetical protein